MEMCVTVVTQNTSVHQLQCNCPPNSNANTLRYWIFEGLNDDHTLYPNPLIVICSSD